MDPLGFDKAPRDTRIVVGMSGGVDSAVTAALLVEAGYDVVGITLQLYNQGAMAGRKGACCAGQDIRDAARVAERLGIPHYVLDYEERFQNAVIDDFASAYAGGETPIPCVRCNQTVKFTDLLGTAKDLGADALATGHYARRIAGRNGPELHRAVDPARDQSYFLFATTRSQLDFLRFPLGDITKAETRRIAARFDLGIAEKADSQDICFVPSGSYANIVARLRPEAVRAGEIVDLTGKVLGQHEGIIHFTIGQRRGLDLGGQADPFYVVRLDPLANRVIVGPRSALARQTLRIGQINWLAGDASAAIGRPLTIKTRSAQPPVLTRIVSVNDGPRGLSADLILDEPAQSIAPGQAGVIYENDRLLGGGWILKEEQADVAA